MADATLIHPSTQRKVVVQSGSDQANQLFKQGYVLAGPETRSITGSSSPTESLSQRIGQGVPDLEQTQKFNTVLIDLLKDFQNVERLPFAERGFNAQQEQVKRLSFTDPDLIGADPSIQSASRGAQSAAVQPTVSGAEQAGRTFASRLQTFGDVLNTAREIGRDQENRALLARQEAMNLITQSFQQFGPDAWLGTDPDELARIEKLAGVPRGYIDKVAQATRDDIARKEAREEELIRLQKAGRAPTQAFNFAFDPNTGELIRTNSVTGDVERIGDNGQGSAAFSAFVAQKEQEAGQTFTPERRMELFNEFQANASNQTLLPDELVSPVNTIANNFSGQQIVKNYNEALNKSQSVSRIVSSGGTGPGDLAIVFEFMKALDPTSVVRESEFDNAAKSGNIFKGAFAQFNRFMNPQGGFLPQNVRDEFARLANLKLGVVQQQYRNLFDETARRINKITGRTDGAEFLTNFEFTPASQFADVAAQHGGTPVNQ